MSLIPAGTVFEGRITFDNLDATEYGSLLAALDPRMLAKADETSWEHTVTSVGGGKPFGFGSVTIDVKPLKTETPGQRYLGEAAPVAPDEEAAITAFRTEIPDTAHAHWAALRNALTFGFIDDAMVWYPPGSGERGDENYDKSFEFFAHTTGLRLSDGYRDLVELPDAAQSAARQELDSEAGEHRQRGQSQPGARSRSERRHGR